jgi:hypothetical protein
VIGNWCDRREPQRQQVNPAGLGSSGRGPPQQCEFRTEFGAARGNAGGGFDLAAAQFQLQRGPTALGLRGHFAIARGRFASFGVDKEKLLLDTEGG